MTKNNKHRVVYAVCRVPNGSQWNSILGVIISGNQRPTGIDNVEPPQFIQYSTTSNSTIDIDVTLESHNTFIRAGNKFFYPHMSRGKVWIYQLLFVCLFCVFVQLQISRPRIKLTASYNAWWFIGVKGTKSPIFVNFALSEAQNRPARVLNYK